MDRPSHVARRSSQLDMTTVWARAHLRGPVSLPELAAEPSVIAEVQTGVDQVNSQLADVEQILRFLLVGEEWLPDSELLTPTSKLRRRSVNSRYAAQIEAMYTDGTELGRHKRMTRTGLDRNSCDEIPCCS